MIGEFKDWTNTYDGEFQKRVFSKLDQTWLFMEGLKRNNRSRHFK